MGLDGHLQGKGFQEGHEVCKGHETRAHSKLGRQAHAIAVKFATKDLGEKRCACMDLEQACIRDT